MGDELKIDFILFKKYFYLNILLKVCTLYWIGEWLVNVKMELKTIFL